MQDIIFAVHVGVLLFFSICRAETVDLKGFSSGTSGYLYNIGTSSYIKKKWVDSSSRVWLKTTKEPEEAVRLKIERGFYNGITYNLIAIEDMNEKEMRVNRGKIEAYTVPFYGIQVASMVHVSNGRFIGATPDTSTPNTWVTFSPPLYKQSNAFRIYFRDECATAETNGYIKTRKCILGPKNERDSQLFMWLPENRYIAKNGIPTPIENANGYTDSINYRKRNGYETNESIQSGDESAIYRRIGKPSKILSEQQRINKMKEERRSRNAASIGGSEGKTYQILPPGF